MQLLLALKKSEDKKLPGQECLEVYICLSTTYTGEYDTINKFYIGKNYMYIRLKLNTTLTLTINTLT